MDLSILIPIYNAGDHIEKCLKSLLNQGIPESEYEIIIIDDGSTDDSVEHVKSIAKQHLNIHLFEETNQGVYLQRNKLLQKARGNYVYFMDADDFLNSNALEPLLRFGIKNDLQIIGFGTKVTRVCEDTIENFQPNFEDTPITSGKQFLSDTKSCRHEIWWYLIAREYINSENIRFYESFYHADVVFTISLLVNVQRMAFVDQIVYNYIQTEFSITRNSDRSSYDKRIVSSQKMLIELNKILNHTALHYSKKYPKLIDNLTYHKDRYLYLLIARMIDQHYDAEYIKETVETLKKNGLFPIKNLKDPDFKGLRYTIVAKIFNTTFLLPSYIKLNRLFKNIA